MFRPDGVLVNSIDELLEIIGDDYEETKKIVYKKKRRQVVRYINLPCSFDIEVSSLTIGDRKASCMYIWQFGINGYAVYGRTWEEFYIAMNKVVDHFNLGTNRRLPIYVHNLAYEFQFIRTHFEWDDIFAREKRVPMKANTTSGLEFRCSYFLSGCSLEQTCKDLVKYKIEKKVGDLDYDILRTPNTPLTDKEIGYAIYDVYCVMNYIKEEMERYDNDVTKIPMTKTGKVRLRCRKACFNAENKKYYNKLMRALKINDIQEYDMLKRAFQGGFTHAGWCNAYFEHEIVQSCDFTSSYPTVLISEEYPMGSGEYIKIKNLNDFRKRAKTHLLIFNVHFTNLRPKFKYEHYLSGSKCWIYNSKGNPEFISEKTKSAKMDNGRIISADELFTTITNVDFEIIERDYDFDTVDFGHGYQYTKGYLPKPFVQTILDLYQQKTMFKDVVGMEGEYMLSKSDINGMFGMTVTDIINDVIDYEMNEWSSHEEDKEEQLNRYNNSRNRFLFYPWGVFCTAYARRNLWSGIFELGKDYIYSDTDSVKYLNFEEHQEYFTKYNEWIIMRLERACEYHGFDKSLIRPKTKDGKEKPLGVWDDEGVKLPESEWITDVNGNVIKRIYARRFKTLGAKRYLIEYWKKDEYKDILDEDGNKTGEKEFIPAHWALKCTIAGVNKKKTSEWFMNDYEHAFDIFTDMMEVPEEYSGRLIATYLDNEDTIEADVTDYLGNTYHMKKNTGIHMSKSAYNLTMTPIYMTLLNTREEEMTC